MAPHFVFPQSLKELEEEHEDNRLYAQNHIDIASLRSSELEEFVKGLSLSLFQNSPQYSVWLLRKCNASKKKNFKKKIYYNFD